MYVTKKSGFLSNKILFALSCRVWLSSFLSQFLTAISNERVCDYEKIFVENEKKLLCKTSAQKVVSSKAKQILLHRKQINSLCKKLCSSMSKCFSNVIIFWVKIVLHAFVFCRQAELYIQFHRLFFLRSIAQFFAQIWVNSGKVMGKCQVMSSYGWCEKSLCQSRKY